MTKLDTIPSVSISGLTSCGKTAVSKMVANRTGLTRISASDILLRIVKERNVLGCQDISTSNHFWLKNTAKILNSIRESPGSNLDKELDEMVIRLLHESRIKIIETLSYPFLVPLSKKQQQGVLSVYVMADIHTRALRAYLSSPTISISDLEVLINEKDETSRRIILQNWGVDICNTTSIMNSHDVVFDNSGFKSLHKEGKDHENKINLDILIACYNLYYFYRGNFLTESEFMISQEVIKKNEKMFRIVPDYFLQPYGKFINK